MYLFTYGILKYDEGLVAENVVLDATMVDLGAFPAILELGTGHRAKGNILKVTEERMARYDMIEGAPDLYRRQTIETSHGECFIYVLNPAVYVEPQALRIEVWESGIR